MKNRIFALPVMLMLLAYSCNAQGSHGYKLTWPTVGVTGATYTVLKSSTPGGSRTVVQSGITVLTFSETLPANTNACLVVVTSVPGMADSAPSNEVCGTTGKDQAPSVTGLSAVFN